MKAKLKFVLLTFMLLTAGAAYGQKTSDKSEIELRGQGQQILLTSRGVRRRLNLKDKINAAKLDEVELLLMSRKDSFIYLLVSACGSSKLVPDARRCGAAEECNLLWIKLDEAWKVQDIKSAAYESCWQVITSTDGYKISGQTLRLEYDNFSEKKHYKLSYDGAQPERAFQIEESALSDSN